MAAATETAPAKRLPPVRVSRTYPAPRALVFEAWSTAEHVKRWFCPAGFTVPHARVHMLAGGPFELCMRAPDGTEHWCRGTFAEVAPPERLVLDLEVQDAAGRPLFRALTAATFADAGAGGGTRLDVVQTYTVLDPDAAWMVEGAPQGWAQTLDHLGEEVARMRGWADAQARIGDEAARQRAGAPVVRSAAHGMFHIQRTYDAPAARVFRALSDPAAKARWFSADESRCQVLKRTMDFRVGGREHLQGRWDGGTVTTFDAVYLDIVPGERIVYAYEMHVDDRKISVSLATLQVQPAGDGRTTLRVTEQGVFLDGYDDAGAREHGTGLLLDRLGASLAD